MMVKKNKSKKQKFFVNLRFKHKQQFLFYRQDDEESVLQQIASLF